jgi:hypothetical protein
VVLLGHLEHALLDEGQHATRIRVVVAARVVAPWRVHPRHIAAAARQHAGDARQDRGAGGTRNIREPGGGRRRHAEERREHRPARTEVEVGQEVVRHARLDGADAGPQAVLPQDQAPAEASAPAAQQRIDERILLPRIHARNREVHRDARDRHVEADEMRREQDHRPAGERLEVLEPLDLHQPLDALARRPPQDAALDEAAAKGPEVRARKALALARRHLRKALLQVDAGHVATLGNQPEQERAGRVADRGYGAQRQEMHQPHEEHHQAREQRPHRLGSPIVSSGGRAPAGVL